MKTIIDVKPETWLSPPGICPACDEIRGIELAPPRECDACGAKLFPGDWLTHDGCCYCDAGLDLLTPWGQA